MSGKAARRRGVELLWLAFLFAASFALIFGFVRPVVASPSIVEGPSMQPTLKTSDRVLIVKPELLVGKPEHGEVVLLRDENGGPDLIKRVVALPGETVTVRGDGVYVDGEPLRGTSAGNEPSAPSGFGTTVPPGHVYVLGDNRDRSTDSRSFGPVSMDRIQGEAILAFWPLGRIRTL